jgi:hypothetical protein
MSDHGAVILSYHELGIGIETSSRFDVLETVSKGLNDEDTYTRDYRRKLAEQKFTHGTLLPTLTDINYPDDIILFGKIVR